MFYIKSLKESMCSGLIKALILFIFLSVFIVYSMVTPVTNAYFSYHTHPNPDGVEVPKVITE